MADKKTLKNAFGALVSNAKAIEGAKFSPWWVGVILFIFGLLLPVVPLFVSSANAKGTSFLSSYEYGLGMDKTFSEAMNSIDGTLTYNKDNNEIFYTTNSALNSDDPTLIGSYISQSGNYMNQYELRIYFTSTSISETEMTNFVTLKENVMYLKGGTVTSHSSDDSYVPSSIYFFKNTFYVDVYGAGSTEKKSEMGFFGDLTCTDLPSGDLKNYFLGNNYTNTEENRLNAYNKLTNLIDSSYKSAKTSKMLWGTLIYLGVYFVLNFFMGLMVFLMSRGKNNPNNYLTFWTCMKIDMWASTAPGILGMILGFIFSNNAVLFYVLLISMRMVWLSSKELRPQQ